MASFRRTLRSAAKRLTARLEQLCHALDTITARLRAATAEVVGETITDIVRDAALYVIDRISRPGAGSAPRRAPSPHRTGLNHNNLWTSDEDDENADYFDDPEFHEDDEFDQTHDADGLPDQAERLSLAVSAGLQVAAWWFKRQAGRGGMLTSMAVSLAATGLAYFAGPFSRALIVLIESATRCGR